MIKITLETLYTPWTLDTYQTFNMDNVEDQIMEYLSSEDGKKYDYDDFEWTYHMDDYLKALADNLVDILDEYIIDDVVLSVSYDGKVSSPKFYNYTTDKAWLDFEVDEIKLRAYVDEHREQYEKEKLQDRDGFWWNGDEYETMLSWYLHEVSGKLLDHEKYYWIQVENVCEDEFVEYKLKK